MVWLKIIRKLEYYKYPRYCGLQERRQFVCFLMTTFVELLYIPANLLGMNGFHHSPAFTFYNWMHLAFVLLLQVAFWRNWFSTRTSLYIFFITICIKLSAESLYQAFTVGLHGMHVLGNFTIILIIAAVAVAVRLKFLALILTIILTVDLLLACFLVPDANLLQIMRVFFVGYMLILFVILFNTKSVGRGLRQPRVINAEEQKALEMLANLNEDEREKAVSLMNRLSPEQKDKIRENVMEHFRQQELDTFAYDKLCPDLTRSEIEICKLVLQGKSLKEICMILNKTESNITSQRAHIRKKLNMSRKEELKSTLEMRIYEIRERINNK